MTTFCRYLYDKNSFRRVTQIIVIIAKPLWTLRHCTLPALATVAGLAVVTRRYSDVGPGLGAKAARYLFSIFYFSDYLMFLSARRLDLFAWCVRLSRLSVGF